jgi:hypothetical protein
VEVTKAKSTTREAQIHLVHVFLSGIIRKQFIRFVENHKKWRYSYEVCIARQPQISFLCYEISIFQPQVFVVSLTIPFHSVLFFFLKFFRQMKIDAVVVFFMEIDFSEMGQW